MISHDQKCIFVHIPKTAGQSIEHVFLGLAGLTWETRAPLVLRANDDPNLGPPRLAHLMASDYVRCGHVTQEQFDSYLKFAFVRNPWARMVSLYKYRGGPKKIDFKTYLHEHAPTDAHSEDYWLLAPQYDFLFDRDGVQLVDYVGRFENLQGDFDEVCGKLGIPQTVLPHINRYDPTKFRIPRNLWQLSRVPKQLDGIAKARRHTFGHYTEYYNDELRDFVGELYKKDVETFKYEFGK